MAKKKNKLEELRSNLRMKELQELPYYEGPDDHYATRADEEYENFYTQYSSEGSTLYRPVPATRPVLPPGFYEAGADNMGIYVDKKDHNSNELIRFPDSVADSVIGEFEKFWSMHDEYIRRGEHHKRGFLLWGPPGGGKTSTVSFIIQDFIKSGNIVLDFSYHIIETLRQIRMVEPHRKVLVVMEDIDSIIRSADMEQIVLQFLDGAVPHKNTIVIATTNYPEQLPDRIINRPSRFDRVSYIGVPTKLHREIYIKEKSKAKRSQKALNKMIKDTDGFTLAHIKELILAVEVFGLAYDETLERLNKMRKRTEHSNDYEDDLRGKHDSLGF